MSRPFLTLFLAVSLLVTAAVLLLIAGLRDAQPLAIGAGAVLAVTGVLGVLALARIVVVSEKDARRR